MPRPHANPPRHLPPSLATTLWNVRLLVWARKSAGLSVEAAAHKTGVTKERLEAWERRDQLEKPTFAQLRKLASVYKRPLAAFYLPEPPKRFEAMHDFRRPAEGALPESPELTFEVRRAHDRREWAIELFVDIEETPPTVEGGGCFYFTAQSKSRPGHKGFAEL